MTLLPKIPSCVKRKRWLTLRERKKVLLDIINEILQKYDQPMNSVRLIKRRNCWYVEARRKSRWYLENLIALELSRYDELERGG